MRALTPTEEKGARSPEKTDGAKKGLGARLAQHPATTDLGELRRAGVEVHRHRHRAGRHAGRATQPDAREEDIGQRRQPAQVQ